MRSWQFLLTSVPALLLLPSPGAADLRHLDPDPTTGTCKAVVVGSVPLAHTAQLLPVDARGQIVGKGQPAAQIEKVLANVELALKAASSGFGHVVKINVYAARSEVVTEVQKALAKKFPGLAKPAVSFVVGALAYPDALVAMDAVAAAPAPGGVEKVARISSPQLDKKAGIHVALMPAGPHVYVSGQAEKGDLAEATRKTLESLRRTLTHLGLNDSHVVQMKAFMRPMTAVNEVREVIAKFYDDR